MFRSSHSLWEGHTLRRVSPAVDPCPLALRTRRRWPRNNDLDAPALWPKPRPAVQAETIWLRPKWLWLTMASNLAAMASNLRAMHRPKSVRKTKVQLWCTASSPSSPIETPRSEQERNPYLAQVTTSAQRTAPKGEPVFNSKGWIFSTWTTWISTRKPQSDGLQTSERYVFRLLPRGPIRRRHKRSSSRVEAFCSLPRRLEARGERRGTIREIRVSERVMEAEKDLVMKEMKYSVCFCLFVFSSLFFRVFVGSWKRSTFSNLSSFTSLFWCLAGLCTWIWLKGCCIISRWNHQRSSLPEKMSILFQPCWQGPLQFLSAEKFGMANMQKFTSKHLHLFANVFDLSHWVCQATRCTGTTKTYGAIPITCQNTARLKQTLPG